MADEAVFRFILQGEGGGASGTPFSPRRPAPFRPSRPDRMPAARPGNQDAARRLRNQARLGTIVGELTSAVRSLTRGVAGLPSALRAAVRTMHAAAALIAARGVSSFLPQSQPSLEGVPRRVAERLQFFRDAKKTPVQRGFEAARRVGGRAAGAAGLGLAGAAGAVGLFTAGVALGAVALNRLAKSSVEAARGFAKFSGAVAGSVALADVEQTLREIRVARARGGASSRRVDAARDFRQALFEATSPFFIRIANFFDDTIADGLSLATGLLEDISGNTGKKAEDATTPTLFEIFNGGEFADFPGHGLQGAEELVPRNVRFGPKGITFQQFRAQDTKKLP